MNKFSKIIGLCIASLVMLSACSKNEVVDATTVNVKSVSGFYTVEKTRTSSIGVEEVCKTDTLRIIGLGGNIIKFSGAINEIGRVDDMGNMFIKEYHYESKNCENKKYKREETYNIVNTGNGNIEITHIKKENYWSDLEMENPDVITITKLKCTKVN